MATERVFTVAIDGPAAAGKGTIAQAIAAKFGMVHLDTGLLYRAVGRRVLSGTPPVIAASTLRQRDIAGTDLRTPEVAQAASEAAAIPEVRDALVEFQRNFSRRVGGAVLDGRDIGTVICPDADVKLFVIANDQARAKRRWTELVASGLDITEADVLRNIQERDARDASRDAAPMVAAVDAIEIDTSEMSIEEAVEAASKYVAAKWDSNR